MVEITFDADHSKLCLKNRSYTPEEFQEANERLFLSGCTFNKTTKCFNALPADLDSIIDDLAVDSIPIEISEFTRRQVLGYFESLKELKSAPFRVIPKWDLMNYPPLVGIHPNENYQKQDIARALNLNRFLFNWDMGLGKSYALTSLISNLWFYNFIDKCIIFSTRAGVYNLKDELCKHGKLVKPEDIYVINSITETEDRDIFNIEKYPYKIIIMPYDTFVSVNDYYYDKANAPKRLPKKIEQAEKELKEFLAEKREFYRKDPKYTSAPDYKTKTKILNEFLKLDREVIIKKKNLSSLKEGMHPSRKLKDGIGKSYIDWVKWANGKNMGVFLDECHSLADPKSVRFQYFKANVPFFDFRYLFTGTLADKYEKLYAPLYLLDKQLIQGRPYTNWIKSFGALGTSYNENAINPDNWNMEKIAKLNEILLRTYGTKRLARECLELPLDYDVPTIHIDMDPLQREIYEGFVKEQLRMVQNKRQFGTKNTKDEILNMFGIFQLAVDNPSCILKTPSFDKFPMELQDKIRNYDYTKDSYKLRVTKDILIDRVTDNGERGIVWYNHPATKEVLVKELKQYNPVVVEAGMKPQDMNRVIKEFQADPTKKIIIASINIMNTSVTITECTFNIYIERTFNYNYYEQSRRRTWRYGQKNTVRYYFMCYNNSIDNLQLDNLAAKGAILNTLMNKDYIDNEMWKKIFNSNGGEVWD